MRLGLVLLALIALGPPEGSLAAPPTEPVAHAAAVCADYPNQAAAQHAADTRDADGDGIYCESLPCPCARPAPTRPATKPRLPDTYNGRCRRGALPDRRCSPGKAATADVARICTPGYSEHVRDVPRSRRDRVFREYGVRRHPRGSYEIDHVIPLELGGSNSVKNLFAEAAEPAPGFHQKDVLENDLHDLVCSGRLDIQVAQAAIAKDWLAAYRRYVG